MTIGMLGPELAAVVRSRRADAADDALALLADAYFLPTAGLWTRGLALLHFRAGFALADERPIPEELWGPELTAALVSGEPVRVESAPDAWRQGERAHLVIPISGAGGRGVLIATSEQPDIPDDLVEHARSLAPLLEFAEGTPRRIADDLERDLGSSLWASLLAVQGADDASARRAAAALRSALADLRAAVLTLRAALPAVTTLREAAERYGEAYSLSVEHDGFPGEEGLAPEARAALISVIREALEDAALRGRARHVRVQAGRTDDGLLVVIVEDDGGERATADLEALAQARGGTLGAGRSELGGLRVEVALPAP